MSDPADKPTETQRASKTFLRTVAILALALAAGEFLLALHFRREADRNVTGKFEQLYYNSLIWLKSTSWLGVPSEQTPTDNWSMSWKFIRKWLAQAVTSSCKTPTSMVIQWRRDGVPDPWKPLKIS